MDFVYDTASVALLRLFTRKGTDHNTIRTFSAKDTLWSDEVAEALGGFCFILGEAEDSFNHKISTFRFGNVLICFIGALWFYLKMSPALFDPHP